MGYNNEPTLDHVCKLASDEAIQGPLPRKVQCCESAVSDIASQTHVPQALKVSSPSSDLMSDAGASASIGADFVQLMTRILARGKKRGHKATISNSLITQREWVIADKYYQDAKYFLYPTNTSCDNAL